MADTEFEEFCKDFDKLPRQIQTNVPFYSLVPDFMLDGDDLASSKSTTSDSSSPTSEDDVKLEERGKQNFDEETNKTTIIDVLQSPQHNPHQHQQQQQQAARRRRKLPEIPKNKKSSLFHLLTNPQHHSPSALSICDELKNHQKGHISIVPTSSTCCPPSMNGFKTGSILALQCSYLLEDDSSPDSEKLFSFGDVDSGCADSGHSTTHSPNDFKSLSPTTCNPASPFPAPYGGIPYSKLEMLEATHRGLHKFVPRHVDEIEVEIGDPIYVQKEADDLWCEGINLRTGRQGIFPSAYAVDLDYNDFDPNTEKIKKERYLLGYLGSVETLAHKGTAVVCQAVKKILGTSNIQNVEAQSPKAQPCIIEISDLGLRMVDRSRNKKDKRPCMDYFYSLKNVSFCAFHPRDHRYIGFITKHPTVQRFACHVFVGTESTRPVAEAVGRAFQRFYQQFIETAYPIEDIYIE